MKIRLLLSSALVTALPLVLCAGSAVPASPIGVLPGAPVQAIAEDARQVAIRTDDGLTRFGSVTQAERNRLREAMLPMSDEKSAVLLHETFGPVVGPYEGVLERLLNGEELVIEGCVGEHSTPGLIKPLGRSADRSPAALAVWEDAKWRAAINETIVHLPPAEAGRLMGRRTTERCRAYERPGGLRVELYVDYTTEEPGRSRRVTIFTVFEEGGGWQFRYRSMTRIGDYVVLLDVLPTDRMSPDDFDALLDDADEQAMAALA
ncbi:hypothetical protein [Actinomadura algeriensis]|uniref:Uncharacterized protein n=1 Tax=Actinomadura algeriensis TaxID=1679523 RepID=A0ABR9K2H2_9ACTN|nr:hypothetical protein [Actinomadura algeriensis]MBE1536535.1 hypothetical protein [Actinomadura algeriensis]